MKMFYDLIRLPIAAIACTLCLTVLLRVVVIGEQNFCPLDVPISAVTAVLGATDTSCVTTRVVPQTYFDHTKFVEVDTGCLKDDEFDAAMVNYRPIRVALDSAGRIYRLFQFDTCEFNALVDARPPSFEEDPISVYYYGLYFVEFALVHTVLYWEHCSIENAQQLKVLNRESLWCSGWTDERWRAKEDSVEQKVDALASRLNAERVRPAENGDGFAVRYYIWYARFGDLREIDLHIDQEGHIYVLSNQIVDSEVGFYDPGLSGVTPEIIKLKRCNW